MLTRASLLRLGMELKKDLDLRLRKFKFKKMYLAVLKTCFFSSVSSPIIL